MSLRYIVDGYNAIHKIPSLKDKPLRIARDGLVGFIRENRLWGSSRNSVTVVFDGKSDIILPYSNTGLEPNINILFSRDETADERIKKLADESPDPKQIVVVTDDRDILYYCRSGGAKVVSIKDWVSKGRRLAQKQDISDDRSELDDITEEFKQLWLRKKR